MQKKPQGLTKSTRGPGPLSFPATDAFAGAAGPCEMRQCGIERARPDAAAGNTAGRRRAARWPHASSHLSQARQWPSAPDAVPRRPRTPSVGRVRILPPSLPLQGRPARRQPSVADAATRGPRRGVELHLDAAPGPWPTVAAGAPAATWWANRGTGACTAAVTWRMGHRGLHSHGRDAGSRGRDG